MYNIVYLWMRFKDLVKLLLVGNVAAEVFGSLAAYEFDSVEYFVGRVVEVVDYDDFIVGFEEGESGKGANVASTAGSLLAKSRNRFELDCLGWLHSTAALTQLQGPSQPPFLSIVFEGLLKRSLRQSQQEAIISVFICK